MISRASSQPKQSRFLEALERTSAARSVITRSAAAGALLVLPLAACSNNDEATFAGADTGAATTSTSAVAGSDSTAAPDTTITTIDGATTVIEEKTTTAPTAGAAFPGGAEMVVDFTFEASGSGRILNPYVAVWVEAPDGTIVKTVSVWFEQSNKGTKYLSDLQRWASVSGESFADSVSGATQVAGSYSVVWDGTDDDGNPVNQGDYVLFIEAAREHGPYELISESITIGPTGFSIDLAPNGELTAASATLSL